MKSFLKLARESISSKDFESALNYADNGLESDEVTEGEKASSNKYNLLVFKALSLHNLGRDKEAIESYELAGMIHPELALAWQGLISLYEKGDYESSKKIKPLENLLRILKASGDPKKHYEILQKLVADLGKSKLFDDAVKHYKWLLGEDAALFYKNVDNFPGNRMVHLQSYIALIEAQEADHISKEIDKRKFRLGAGTVQQIRATVESELILASPLNSLYQDLISSLPSSEADHFKIKLGKRLFIKLPTVAEKTEMLGELLVICKENAGKDVELAEILLNLSDEPDYNKDLISKYFMLENAKYPSAAQYYLSGETVDFTFENSSVFSLFTACKVLNEKEQYEELIKIIPVLSTLLVSMESKYGVSYPVIKDELLKLEISTLVNLEKYGLARSKLDLLPRIDELFEARIKIYEALGDHSSSIELLNHRLEGELENGELLSSLGWEYFHVKSFDEAFKFLSKAEAICPDNAETLYRLGRVHWELPAEDSKAKALNYFLRSVKSNSDHAGSFLYLGLYYDLTDDLIRAEKCFNKALRLDEDLVEAAVNLARLWIARVWNDQKQHIEIGTNVINLLSVYAPSNLRNWRLWKYLGIAYSWKSERQLAITAFQNALKGEHADELECLHLLAEAYRVDQKMTAALKAYARAVSVDSGCMVAKIGHATVLMEIGKYEEAVEGFEGILITIEPHLSSAINFQLAKSCSLWFQELVLNIEYDSAMKVAAKGLGILANALKGSNMITGWRASASLSFSLYPFTKRADVTEIVPLIDNIMAHTTMTGNDVYDSIMKLPEPFLRLSALSYLKCLSLADESGQSHFWSELAKVFYTQHSLSGNSDLLGCADSYCNQAIELSSSNWEAWNILGLIALEQGRTAYSQHAFIMALECSPSENSSIWMNLAKLFHQNKDIELANQAVEKAQMADVENPMPWFAQAQLALLDGTEEGAGKAFELLGEAVGCPQASLHVEINLLYARLAWDRLKFACAIGKRELLDRLNLALERVINLETDNGWALHTLGLVKELMGADGEVVKGLLLRSLGTVGEEHKEGVLCNLVRVLVSCGDYEEALKISIPDNQFVQFFQALAKARLAKDSAPLHPFTSPSFHEQMPSLWKVAIWESATIGLSANKDVSGLLDGAAEISPSSQVVVGAKFLDAVMKEKDAEEIEVLLLTLIELSSEPIERPNPTIITLITGYLSTQQCHLEAFEFFMAILENNLSDTHLWDAFIGFYQQFKATVEGGEVRERVGLAVREWVDVHVPQLGSRPKMDDMEAYSERLFPTNILDDVINIV